MLRDRTFAYPIGILAVAVCLVGIVAVASRLSSEVGAASRVTVLPDLVVSPGTAGTCRLGSPCGSLATALQVAGPGDRIEVEDGQYGETTLAPDSHRGAFSRTPVVIAAAENARPHFAALVINHDNLLLEGLQVDGLTTIAGAGGLVLSHGSFAGIAIQEGAHDTEVRDSTIGVPDASRSGVEVASGTHNISVAGTKITGGARGVHIYSGDVLPPAWASDITIKNNDISGASGDDIQIAGARHVEISGNFIHDPQQNPDHNDGIQTVGSDDLRILDNTFNAPGAIDADQGIILSHADPPNPNMKVMNTVVENNIIHGWRGSGITVAGAINTTIVNNTSYDNGDRKAGVVSAGLFIGTLRGQYVNENLRVFNNVFENIRFDSDAQPPTYEDFNCVRTGGTGVHDIARDPRFVDREHFALANDSPCAGSGTSTDAPQTDIQNQQRASPPDMGATEHRR